MTFLRLSRGRAARLAVAALVACWLAFPIFAQLRQSSANPAAVRRQPVLVELFTSEGCSDCPPADALLAKLDANQFVPGAQAIVLSEHVTYWDTQGWRDPFSLDAVTARQRTFSQNLGLSDVYTPQMVVDGTEQFVGNDAAALIRAVARAAGRPKQEITIENAQWADGTVSFSVRAAASPETKMIVALAENETHSEVLRGENAGRTLYHVAVVPVIKEFGSNSADGRPLRLSTAEIAGTDKTAGPLRLVVFLVGRSNDRVVGVAEQRLRQQTSAVSAEVRLSSVSPAGSRPPHRLP